MNKWADLKIRTISAVALVAGLVLILELHIYAFYALLFVATFILLKEWYGLVRARKHKALWIIVGIVYILLGALGLATIRYISGAQGIYIMVTIVAVIDIAAYITGKLIGRHKIAPTISPGKSWEGFAGSLIGGMLAVYLVPGLYAGTPPTALIYVVTFGATFATLGLLGDMFESYMKRKADVKDSGTLIPGHGGLFDRVDALLPCAILIFFLFVYIYLFELPYA